MTTVKVVVLGLGAVGKSCLSIRFVQNTFMTEYEPTISNTYKKAITLNNQQYSLDILDTAGMETQEALKPQIYRDRDVFILVYAINERESFDNISKIHSDIQRYKDTNKFPCVLCANKIDLENERQVSYEDGKALATTLGAQFLETSAKTGVGVQEIMTTAVNEYLKMSNIVINNGGPDPSPKCKCNIL
ncbi:Ras family GTPase [Histomonas meleagridis]|uniref:Ras family GTPase n=1 Tax=Histomonas meleagridis TaxID=135588 RepID=UPI00355A6743|nr:Ras family GTPase [Histomonas meleagridis]KAH0801417.1 Ras family GTPase [Histomonas meleagridis]